MNGITMMLVQNIQSTIPAQGLREGPYDGAIPFLQSKRTSHSKVESISPSSSSSKKRLENGGTELVIFRIYCSGGISSNEKLVFTIA